MQKNHVLKDTQGRPRGYLMQTQEEILCRADTKGRCAQAVILLENGKALRIGLSDGAEERQPWSGCAVSGGYVQCEDGLLLATGEAARRAYERERFAPQESRTAPKDAPAGGTETAAKSDPPPETEEGQSSRAFPERRWPPPPCLTQARYIQGGWRETDQVSG